MIEELRELKKLLDENLITSEEYDSLKNKILYGDVKNIPCSSSSNDDPTVFDVTDEHKALEKQDVVQDVQHVRSINVAPNVNEESEIQDLSLDENIVEVDEEENNLKTEQSSAESFLTDSLPLSDDKKPVVENEAFPADHLVSSDKMHEPPAIEDPTAIIISKPAVSSRTKTPTSSKPSRKPLVAIVCILLLAIVIGAVWYINSGSSSRLTEMEVAPGQEFKKVTGECPYSFTIDTPKGQNYYVYLKDVVGNNDLSFFVYGGRYVTKNMPAGTYMIYYCTGKTWYGSSDKFGPDTQYYTTEMALDFPVGDDFSGWSYSISSSDEGIKIESSEFPD